MVGKIVCYMQEMKTVYMSIQYLLSTENQSLLTLIVTRGNL